MAELQFDANGLICAIAQDASTGDVRMVAWMNRAALEKTLETGLATFYSRSRKELWTKGETSGNTLKVLSIHADCDRDTLLLRVTANGPSCHTGSATCFFQRVDPSQPDDGLRPAATVLTSLERALVARQASTAERSYTKSLLDKGTLAIAEKVREEGSELARAIESESDDRVLSEAADVVYHLLVGLRARDLSFDRVIEVLASRSGQSGHAEKASRSRDGSG
jgi:phosphoribosyl-ATP pyrophosphohydrolase/phosphoribosyl-AMP cyclohydrolase